MSNATVRRLITRALVSAVIFVPQANTITQVNLGTPQREQLGQYCAPPGENEVPRLYCRDRHGDSDIRAWATHADLMPNSAGAFDVR